jgi:hypothetical protein
VLALVLWVGVARGAACRAVTRVPRARVVVAPSWGSSVRRSGGQGMARTRWNALAKAFAQGQVSEILRMR